jgi:hypothetical protein
MIKIYDQDLLYVDDKMKDHDLLYVYDDAFKNSVFLARRFIV